MAKDGTNRGGRRTNSGRKHKPVFEKIENNNPGHRPIKVIDPQVGEITELEGVEMPKIADYLSAVQRDGEKLIAGEIDVTTCEKLFTEKSGILKESDF